jgi:hypothetical protein
MGRLIWFFCSSAAHSYRRHLVLEDKCPGRLIQFFCGLLGVTRWSALPLIHDGHYGRHLGFGFRRLEDKHLGWLIQFCGGSLGWLEEGSFWRPAPLLMAATATILDLVSVDYLTNACVDWVVQFFCGLLGVINLHHIPLLPKPYLPYTHRQLPTPGHAMPCVALFSLIRQTLFVFTALYVPWPGSNPHTNHLTSRPEPDVCMVRHTFEWWKHCSMVSSYVANCINTNCSILSTELISPSWCTRLSIKYF